MTYTLRYVMTRFFHGAIYMCMGHGTRMCIGHCGVCMSLRSVIAFFILTFTVLVDMRVSLRNVCNSTQCAMCHVIAECVSHIVSHIPCHCHCNDKCAMSLRNVCHTLRHTFRAIVIAMTNVPCHCGMSAHSAMTWHICHCAMCDTRNGNGTHCAMCVPLQYLHDTTLRFVIAFVYMSLRYVIAICHDPFLSWGYLYVHGGHGTRMCIGHCGVCMSLRSVIALFILAFTVILALYLCI